MIYYIPPGQFFMGTKSFIGTQKYNEFFTLYTVNANKFVTTHIDATIHEGRGK